MPYLVLLEGHLQGLASALLLQHHVLKLHLLQLALAKKPCIKGSHLL